MNYPAMITRTVTFMLKKNENNNKSDQRSSNDKDSDNMNINIKIQEKTIYNNYLGQFTFFTNLAATLDGYLDSNLLRSIIKSMMHETLECYFPLSFYSGIKPYNGYWSAYARCLVSSHPVRFKFDIRERNANVLEVDANSNTPITFAHKPTETPYAQKRGDERKHLMKLSM